LSNQRWFYDSSLVSSALREVYDFSNLHSKEANIK